MKPEEQLDIVRKVVSEYFDKYGEEYLPIHVLMFDEQHVVEIGTSLLCSKWNVGYPGGDFVKAILDNDLSETFGRADEINVYSIRFYVMLMYNVEMPTILIQ